jgi:hypothetical protein
MHRKDTRKLRTCPPSASKLSPAAHSEPLTCKEPHEISYKAKYLIKIRRKKRDYATRLNDDLKQRCSATKSEAAFRSKIVTAYSLQFTFYWAQSNADCGGST